MFVQVLNYGRRLFGSGEVEESDALCVLCTQSRSPGDRGI